MCFEEIELAEFVGIIREKRFTQYLMLISYFMSSCLEFNTNMIDNIHARHIS